MHLEIERSFLIKYIPHDLNHDEYKEIYDVYFPRETEHPKIRIRKKGNSYELTKKTNLSEDFTTQEEYNTPLTQAEFEYFENIVDGKKIRKYRYYYNYNGLTAEIDIFKDALEGLGIVEFEFLSNESKNNFVMPEFCLCEITQEDFLAGGALAAQSFEDIQDKLSKYSYKKL